MAIHFGPKVVLYNAFLSKQAADGSGRCSLSFDDLRKFCSDLYDSVVKLGYKYVVLDCEKDSIDAFCDKEDGFVRGIDKIFCIHGVDSAAVNDVNRRYPEDIQQVLGRSFHE